MEITSDFYEKGALLRRDEESVLIVGILLGLNVVDFTFCIKGNQLDSKDAHEIDFGSLLHATAKTRSDSGADGYRDRYIITSFFFVFFFLLNINKFFLIFFFFLTIYKPTSLYLSIYTLKQKALC